MKSNLLTALAALLPCSVILHGCAAHISGGQTSIQIGPAGNGSTNHVEETVQKSFLAAKVKTLRTNLGAGNIEIKPSLQGEDQITVQATKVITGKEPATALKPLLTSIVATATMDGDALVVSATSPATWQSQGIGARIDYVINVPSRIKLDVKTETGHISLQGIHGGGTANAQDGSIEANDIGDVFSLLTGSGSLRVEKSPALTGLTLKSDSGNIDVSGVSGKVTADTASGSITASDVRTTSSVTVHSDSGIVLVKSCTGSIAATSDSGEVTVENCHPTGRLEAGSGSGNVQASNITQGSPGLEVALKTESGTVRFLGEAASLSMSSESGNASAEIMSSKPLTKASVKCGNGQAELIVPTDASATVTARTGNGQLELPGGLVGVSTSEDGKKQTVSLGGGAAKVSIQSENGDVVLRTR